MKRAQGSAMELFTLTIWLWMGARFEEMQIPNLGRGDASSGS